MIENITQPIELNIIKIFANNEYMIPIYQRSYAWEKDEIEQLITDIYDSEGKYYLGSLIVDNIEHNKYSVIDGQQRLTTIYLLLSFLKPELLKYNSLTFEARDKSNATLKAIREGLEIADESYFSQEISNGYSIIKNYFNSKNQIYKNNFLDKLSNIIIIRTQVPRKIDLNHYFEIMNTRGEQLEIHEIAKGRLLGKLDKEDRLIASLIWDGCSQMDSYIQMNFNTNIRPKLFGENWDTFIPKNFEDIRKIFIETNIEEKQNVETKSLSQDTLFSLFSKLNNYVPSRIDTNKKIVQEENKRFESIVSFPSLLLMINEAIDTSNDEDDGKLDDKKFIETLEHHWIDKSSAETFLYYLLRYRFLFDIYILKRETIGEKSGWSLEKLERYHDSKKNSDKPIYKNTFEESDNYYANLRMLQSALRITYTSPKTMHWIAKLLSKIANVGEINSKDMLYTLESYTCNKIVEADYKNVTGFGIARIIFTYIDYILIRDEIEPIKDYQFQFRTSIEHFFPQNPSDPLVYKWQTPILNNLGNLALITVSANSKFSNLSPQSKIDTYPDTINQSPKLKYMSRLMKENNKWDETIAEFHGNEMISLLDKELSRMDIK